MYTMECTIWWVEQNRALDCCSPWMQGAYYGAYDMERTNPVICTTWHDLSVGYTMAVVIVVDARNKVPGINIR